MPSGWAKNIRSAILHVVFLAHYAILSARAWQYLRRLMAGDLDVVAPQALPHIAARKG